MKKNLMLLMLGLVFSFGTYANNEVKKEKVHSTTVIKNLSEFHKKLYSEVCIEAEVFVIDCPDGSIGIYIAYVTYGCGNGQYYFSDFLDEEDGYGCW